MHKNKLSETRPMKCFKHAHCNSPRAQAEVFILFVLSTEWSKLKKYHRYDITEAETSEIK